MRAQQLHTRLGRAGGEARRPGHERAEGERCHAVHVLARIERVEDFLRAQRRLPAARHIIGCYEEYLRTDKSLARMPHWFFADWAMGFDYGEPNYGQDGSSAYQNLVFVMALREQAAMEKAFGLEVLGNYYHDLARQITAAIKVKYWNSARGLLADTPEHDVYSQHVNALAILAEVLEELPTG